jgi:hypothetical protein
MTGYHQDGGSHSHHAPQQGAAHSLGESLGALFFTAGSAAAKILGGGIRLVGRYARREDGCRCASCCDSVECRPPVYSGCCHRCGG